MIAFLTGIAGAAALIIWPLAAWVAFQAFREGDAPMGWKAVAVTGAAAVVFFSQARIPIVKDDCRIEWDGRANPTVCD